jgi:CCR4-NOT transcription complex subunit 3
VQQAPIPTEIRPPPRTSSPVKEERLPSTVLSLLSVSYKNKMHPADTEAVSPINPVPFRKRGVQLPTVPMVPRTEVFSKLDEDTLFFICYFQPGTYAQYLAVNELHHRNWRFHTKQLLWLHCPAPGSSSSAGRLDASVCLCFDHESWCKKPIPGVSLEPQLLDQQLMAS